MSGAEEAAGPAGVGVGAGAGSGAGAGAGIGVGAAAGPAAASSAAASSAAALGEAAGPGPPDEAGLAGARPLQLQEAPGDPDAPPKKRLRAAEAAEAAAGSGKLEERLYSVLCCTVCLDLPKASVYQRSLPGLADPAGPLRACPEAGRPALSLSAGPACPSARLPSHGSLQPLGVARQVPRGLPFLCAHASLELLAGSPRAARSLWARQAQGPGVWWKLWG